MMVMVMVMDRRSIRFSVYRPVLTHISSNIIVEVKLSISIPYSCISSFVGFALSGPCLGP